MESRAAGKPRSPRTPQVPSSVCVSLVGLSFCGYALLRLQARSSVPHPHPRVEGKPRLSSQSPLSTRSEPRTPGTRSRDLPSTLRGLHTVALWAQHPVVPSDAPHLLGLSYRWLLNEFPNFIPTDGRHFVSQTTGNLYIARTNASDLGNYSCLATSHMDFSTKSVFSKFAQLNLAAEGQGLVWGREGEERVERVTGHWEKTVPPGSCEEQLVEPRLWGLDPWILWPQGPRTSPRSPGGNRDLERVCSELCQDPKHWSTRPAIICL